MTNRNLNNRDRLFFDRIGRNQTFKNDWKKKFFSVISTSLRAKSLIIETKTEFTFKSIFSKTDNLLFRWRKSSSSRKRDREKNLKYVRFTTEFKQREFQQKKFLLYEKYRQKLFQQKFFYIFEKKTRVFRKNDFKSIFNHERIHDRNRTTNFYADDSQFISRKKRRFQIVTKKKFFVENMNTIQIMIDMTIEKNNFIVK